MNCEFRLRTGHYVPFDIIKVIWSRFAVRRDPSQRGRTKEQ